MPPNTSPPHASKQPPDADLGPALISAAEFTELCDEHLPFARLVGMQVDHFGTDRVDLRGVFNNDFLRPGGTVAGPVMMALADAAMFGAILARLGPVALAVTTNLSIDFLRKPAPADVVASAQVLKLGKRLAVGDIMITSDADGELVARASATYSLPQF